MVAARDNAGEQAAARFRLTYDGDGLDAIDVNDLAPALLGLGEIIDAINAEVTAGTQSIRVRVRAGFQSGSFVIDLELIRATYGKLIELFAGKDLSALDTFLGVLGIAGVPGLIQLFRKSKGQPARRVVEIEQTNRVRVTFEDGREEEVEKALWRMFNTPSLRAGFTRLVKPLRAAGIELLELSRSGGPVERITEDEINYFSIPSEHEGELNTESERVLRVVSVSFWS